MGARSRGARSRGRRDPAPASSTSRQPGPTGPGPGSTRSAPVSARAVSRPLSCCCSGPHRLTFTLMPNQGVGSGQGRSQHARRATSRPSRFRPAHSNPRASCGLAPRVPRARPMAARLKPFSSRSSSRDLPSSGSMPPRCRTWCLGVMRKGITRPQIPCRTQVLRGMAVAQPGRSARRAWRLPRLSQPTLSSRASQRGSNRLSRSMAL